MKKITEQEWHSGPTKAGGYGVWTVKNCFNIFDHTAPGVDARANAEAVARLPETARAIVQAEAALGENIVWLSDQLDLRIRQGDSETLRRLAQLNAAWAALARVLPR